MKNERRSKKNYRLRVYIDAIAQAKAMTDAEWLQEWIVSGMPWYSRQDWIAQLERWALNEAEYLFGSKAA